MKTFSTLFAAVGILLASTAFSQEAASGLALRTRVASDELPRSTMMDIYVTGANQSNVLYKLAPEQTTSSAIPSAKFKYFYMFEPEDFLSAKESYQNAHFRESRAKFSKVKARLAPIMGLDDGYFQAAALLEIDSAVALLDWASVKELTSAFPKQSPLTEEMKSDMEIYMLFAKMADQAYDQVISSSKKLLASKNKFSLDQLSRLHYILGAALAEKNQEEALDHLAYAVVGAHGGNRELAASAIQKSLELYMKNQKLVDLAKRVNMGTLNASNMGSVLQEAKDAGALVYLFKNVLFPDRVLNPKFDWMLKFYVSPVMASKAKVAATLLKEPSKKEAAAAPSKK